MGHRIPSFHLARVPSLLARMDMYKSLSSTLQHLPALEMAC